jgi:hypothetical protein
MVQVVLNQEQARLIQESLVEPIQLCDPQGRVIRTLEPELTPEFITELKRRAGQPGPRFSGAQVKRHLQRLQEAWDREGGFDVSRMRELLQEIRAEDPPAA